MLGQAQPVQPGQNGGAINGGSRLAIGEHQHQRHQALDDGGIAVGGEVQHVARARRVQPHLAGTAAHLVGVGFQARIHRGQGSAQRNDQAIFVVPIVEGFEFSLDIIESCDGHDRSPWRLRGAAVKSKINTSGNGFQLADAFLQVGQVDALADVGQVRAGGGPGIELAGLELEPAGPGPGGQAADHRQPDQRGRREDHQAVGGRH